MSGISKADISLAQLRALVAVVEAGGFTAAGERLGLTQSGVSQAIAGLEAALGVALLVRDRTGVVPTEVGGRVLAEAREVVSRLETIRQHAARARGLEAGTLRIGSVPSAAARLLPGLLRTFGRRHPGIDLVLLEGTDDEVVDWLRARVIDVGFTAAASASGTEFIAVPAAEDELRLMVPKGHRFATRAAVQLAELEGEPLLMPAGGCEPLIRAAFRRAGHTPRVTFTVRDLGTLLAMVGEGLGVTLVPELALPAALGALRAIRLDPPVRRQLLLVTSSPQLGAPAVGVFIDQAQLSVKAGC